MAKKIEAPKEKIEREYVISLRKYFVRVPRYKRVNRAVKGIKEFLAQHMKIRDRDLKKIKLDVYLNEYMWKRSIKKPPVKVKVKVVKEKGIVTVSLADMPDTLKFKKAREEKREQKALEQVQKKKTFMDKAKEATQKPKETETIQPGEEVAQPGEQEKQEKKAEEKQKKSAVVEAGEKMSKAAAKQTKHQAGGKTKQPKHQQRKALAK